MIAYLWIALGSGIGGMARYSCQSWAARLMGETFPWGTLLVNLAGSSLLGFFAAFTGPDSRVLVGSSIRQFVMVGICGGFTTFSAFSLETLNLARDGQWWRVGGNVLGSLALCFAGVWAGHALASSLNQR